MSRGTVGLVDHDTYFTVLDGGLVGLEASSSLPDGFTAVLANRIELFLEQRVLTIGDWPDSPDRPHVLALDATGALISMIAVEPDMVDSLADRLDSIDRWLAPLRLRDLSDLSGDPVAFYEGLLDLQPDSTMSLNPSRRVVLVTALDTIDLADWAGPIGPSQIEMQYFDVLAAPGGSAPIITRRTPTPEDVARAETAITPLADVIDLTANDGVAGTAPLPPPPDAVSGDETSMWSPLPDPPEQLPPPTIDLTATPPSPVSPIDASVLRPAPKIRPGATFAIDRLPLLFDPLGANLMSISDELFAVDQHLVLVEKLPERRRETPFEDRNRFRWDSSANDIELLETHAVGADGSRRVIHLFVETERQGPYCVYIGELERLDARSRSNEDVGWFSISPTLDNDLYRLLRKGRLPEHIETPTIDFGTLDV